MALAMTEDGDGNAMVMAMTMAMAVAMAMAMITTTITIVTAMTIAIPRPFRLKSETSKKTNHCVCSLYSKAKFSAIFFVINLLWSPSIISPF